MDEPGWLTITEIARRLGRPPSTVTYWRNTFRDVLAERLGDDEHPTYRLDVFQRLAVLMGSRTAHAEIRRELTDEQTPVANLDELILAELRAIRTALADLPAIRAALEKLADRNDRG